jgi:L-cysteine/cystine lyase
MVSATKLSQTIEQFRSNVPALKNKAYMNFGAQGVLAQETIDAIGQSYSWVQQHGPLSGKVFGWLMQELRDTRQAFADEFGCAAANLALTQSTTDGCNIVLWGLPWQAGDDLLITDAEHAGVIAATHQLAKRHNLNLRVCPVDGRSEDQILQTLEQQLTDKTRVFLFSHILWTTGQTLPIKEIIDLCRSRGVLTLVDGAQSAGVLDLDLPASKADCYAVTGHKWLGGPDGVGALYLTDEAIERLEPTFVGWRSSKFDSHGAPSGWEEGAARFEVATAPFPLLAATRKAIYIRREHGTAGERYQLVLDNATRLRGALSALNGVQCLSSKAPTSGLVSFKVEGGSHRQICDELERQQIIVRTLPSPDCLRASLHYFTSEDEIKKLISVLAPLTA